MTDRGGYKLSTYALAILLHIYNSLINMIYLHILPHIFNCPLHMCTSAIVFQTLNMRKDA